MRDFLKVVKRRILSLRNLVPSEKGPKKLYIIASQQDEKYNEIISRIRFFEKDAELVRLDKPSFAQFFDHSLVAFVGQAAGAQKRMKFIKYAEAFNFDFDSYYLDGWEYHRMLSALHADDLKSAISKGKEILREKAKSLSGQYKKAYVFGTGPSLEKAMDRDWSDGIRIVSNTIVKDAELWHHIKPQFIVAGDAIYHFGFSNFAKSFRRDLMSRLEESPDTYFLIPALFFPFVKVELGNRFLNRIVPVPINPGTKEIFHKSLLEDYTLPSVGNVLPLLLLPLASTLSKNVGLWGFDGRAPGDKMFWKNSEKHFYTSEVQHIVSLHPAFYQTLLPKNNESEYVKSVHGDKLDNAMQIAENEGFVFELLHFSYTETLMKRYAE